MEKMTKALLVLTALVVAVSMMEVEGARMLKEGDQVKQPQTFYGGVIGGAIPGPGFHGFGWGPNGFYTIPGFGGGTLTGGPAVTNPPTVGAQKP